MISRLVWTPERVDTIASTRHNSLRGERVGVMLHYDGSASDEGSLSWFADPRCQIAYQAIVLDDGDFVEIAPNDRRAWHAGRCKSSDPRLEYTDANSAFYGLAIASSGKHGVEPLQLLTVAYLVRQYFEQHGWSLDETWRIVGHDTEAWKRGRKVDPVGSDPLNPILSVDHIRQLMPLVEVPA